MSRLRSPPIMAPVFGSMRADFGNLSSEGGVTIQASLEYLP